MTVVTLAQRPVTAPPARRSVVVRRAALTVWAAALVTFCFLNGVPFDRATQTWWIMSGVLLARIGKPWRSAVRVVADWLPLVGVLYLYDYSRGAADALGIPVHVVDPVYWDRALLFGNDATPWLQQRFSDPSAVHWWDTAASLIYVTHFLLVWIIAAVLYLRDRREWFLWGRALVVLSYAALVTFVIFPSAPPWYAGGQGVIAPVARIATRGLDPIGLHAAAQLVNQGTASANDVAAIPSLHTAFAVLVAAWFWPRVPARYRWWLRPILFAYPVLMLATLVYTGEHYIVDGLIGALYVAAVLIGLRAWDTWRSRRAPTAELAAAAHRPPAPLGSPVSGAAPIALGSRASAHATPTAQTSADSLSRVCPQEQT